MARMGMDVDEVERAGRDLKGLANDLRGLMSRIDGVVNNLPSIWEGKDANDFVQDWWPGHKRNLDQVIGSIDGLGQSALNNASEQRNVSGH